MASLDGTDPRDLGRLDDRPAGPAARQVPCAGCGAPIDPLRAGHVAIFNAQFHYFCDYDPCRQRMLRAAALPPRAAALEGTGMPSAPPQVEEPLPLVAVPVRGAEPTASPLDDVPELLLPRDGVELLEPIPARERASAEVVADAGDRRDLGGVLLVLALIAGSLAVALELAEQVRLVIVSRALLGLVGAGALAGRALTTPWDPAEARALVPVIPVAFIALFAPGALLLGEPSWAVRACFLGAVAVFAAAASQWLLSVAARPVVATRRALERQLDQAARKVFSDGPVRTPELTLDVTPGEMVAVEAGETVPVDLEIREGEAEALPWLGATHAVRRRAGDHLVAGARILRGHVLGICTRSGPERSLARSTLSADWRCDVHAPIARLARTIAERWSWVGGAIAGLAVIVADWGAIDPFAAAMVTAAVWVALANGSTASMASLAVARGVGAAASRGVVYEDAATWSVCTRVTAAVFCARGTLMRGEPELAEVEPLAEGLRSDDLVGLAAGSLVGVTDPIAVAVKRAARDRGAITEPVRNARQIPAMGVTAIASTGEPLAVGNRALLLERRIAMAAAESRITELESGGRSVLLVARAGRLVGLLAFQDGLRPGARSAVQGLVEAGIEPVLLSADARHTSEAIGRSLDIEHLRPEVADGDRADTVRGLSETGAVVAAIGHTPFDDAALSAADVAVVLSAAGRAGEERRVSLVSDDVRDASLALSLADRTRRQAIGTLALVLAPALFGCLVVAARLLPPEYAPLALLLGTAAATAHLRAWDRKLGPRSA